MECDDLKSLMCEFHPHSPSISPDQVHIVMWERVEETGKPTGVRKANTISPKNAIKRRINGESAQILAKMHSQTVLKSPLQSNSHHVSVNQKLLAAPESSDVETYLIVTSPAKIPVSEQLKVNVTVQGVTENGHSLDIGCDKTILNSSLQSKSVNQHPLELPVSSECETYLVVTSPGKGLPDEQSQKISQCFVPTVKSSLKTHQEVGKQTQMNSQISFAIRPTIRSLRSPISASSAKAFSPLQHHTAPSTKALFSYTMNGNKLQKSSDKFVKQSAAPSTLSHVNKIKSNLSILHLQNNTAAKQNNSRSTDLTKRQSTILPNSIFKSPYSSRSSLSQEKVPSDSVNRSDQASTNSTNTYLAALKPFLQRLPKMPSTLGKQSFAGYTLRGSKGSEIQNGNTQGSSNTSDKKRKMVSPEKHSTKRSKQTSSNVGTEDETRASVSQSSEESNVLKNLYDALNLPFPVSSAHS